MATTTPGFDVDVALVDVAAHGLVQPGACWPDEGLDDPTFEALCSAASRERLSGLLLDLVEDEAVPATEGQRDLAAGYAARWYERTRVIDAALLEVHGQLAQAGIDYRVVKGPATAILAYGDTLRRPYTDLDVAIVPHRFAEALLLLTRARWRRLEPDRRPGLVERLAQSVTLGDGAVELDLHRMLVHPPAGDRLPLAPAFEVPARMFDLDGVSLSGLPAADAAVHSAAHAAFDHQLNAPLLRARDLVGLAALVGVDERRTRAQAWGLEATVERRLAQARTQLGLGEGDAAHLVPDDAERAALAVHGRDPSVGRLWSLPRWRDKTAWSVATALPSREYLRFVGETRGSRLRRTFTRATSRGVE